MQNWWVAYSFNVWEGGEVVGFAMEHQESGRVLFARWVGWGWEKTAMAIPLHVSPTR